MKTAARKLGRIFGFFVVVTVCAEFGTAASAQDRERDPEGYIVHTTSQPTLAATPKNKRPPRATLAATDTPVRRATLVGNPTPVPRAILIAIPRPAPRATLVESPAPPVPPAPVIRMPTPSVTPLPSQIPARLAVIVVHDRLMPSSLAGRQPYEYLAITRDPI